MAAPLTISELDAWYRKNLGRPLGQEGADWWLGGGSIIPTTDHDAIFAAIKKDPAYKNYQDQLRREAQERAARERAAQERAARERAAQEAAARAAQERAAQERAAQERAAQERAAQERAAQERAAQERAAQEAAAREAESKGPAATMPGGGITSLPGASGITDEQVRQAYLDLFNRTPSPDALGYWTGSETEVRTPEQLRQAIMEGPEYQAKLAGDTTTKQIQDAYREMLGRDPTIADYEYWTGIDFDADIAASDAPTTLEEINQIRQAMSESPEFQQRVEQGLEQPFQPQGGMTPFTYTDFPGGVYGPGQAMPVGGQGMPNIFQPAAPMPAAQAPGTAAPGPGTYSYPQPFGNVDIFQRPGAQAPTAPAVPQQNMGQAMNPEQAQRLLGNVFG